MEIEYKNIKTHQAWSAYWIDQREIETNYKPDPEYHIWVCPQCNEEIDTTSRTPHAIERHILNTHRFLEPKQEKPTCQTCMYLADQNECRRYPPKLLYDTEAGVRSLEWPQITHPTLVSCGEYEEKEEK